MEEQMQAIKMGKFTTENDNSNWKSLYKVGGFAALLSLFFFPIQIAVYLINPPPDTVMGWFTLINERPLIGLLDLDLLLVVDQVLVMLIFLALYVVLRQTSKSLIHIGLMFGLVTTVLLIASNPAFAMLSLSNQYFSTANETIQTMTLAAGQAMIANWTSSAFHVSYILGSIAAIVISVAMLHNKSFSKTAAYLGILSNVIAFGLYIPVIGVYVSIFSVVPLWFWYLLIALDLLKLGRIAQPMAE
ncbi:MAG: hypothetical protein WA109_04625 [Bellilinea sp.]